MAISWKRVVRSLAIAGALAVAAAPARADTFDFYIFTYCPTADPLCGFTSQAAHRLYMKSAVHLMNMEWEPAGISFRPVVFDIEVEDYYSQTSACDGGVSDEIRARRQEWRTNVAASFPYAISVIITPGWRCCTDPPNGPWGDPNGEDAFPNLLGIFCSKTDSARRLGSVLAHEMGHYFCLRHTHTHQDPATHGAGTNHDLDGPLGVGDTPDDPAPKESFDPNSPAGDLDEDDNLVNGHEWCDDNKITGMTDDGSPYDTFCDPICYLRDNDVTTESSYEPAGNVAMSYYMPTCHGPYVVNGATTYAFTPDQINTIRAICIPQVPDRTILPDVCVSHGGDADHDGICQFEDNCQNARNTTQEDPDGDGQGNECDLCNLIPGPMGDLDGDGLGDLCDEDADGDGCDDDTVDDNPLDGHVRVGYRFNSSCGFGFEPILASAGIDSDDDGVRGCQDVDNDNDGICDGPAAQGPGAPGAPPGGCAAGPDPCTESAGNTCLVVEGSPTQCPPYWFDCLGGGCVDYFLKIVSVVNPSENVVLDRFFQMTNRRIYAASPAGKTISQVGRALTGDFAGFASLEALPLSEPEAAGAGAAFGATDVRGGAGLLSSVRLELWSRKTNQVVAIIGVFDPSGVTSSDLRRGNLLEIIPTVDVAGNAHLAVAAVYGVPADGAADSDGDGRPDTFDNCLLAANFLQSDADGDGFGDVCDADIDGDLLVTDIDIAEVQGCAGADLAYEVRIAEGELDVGVFPPDPIFPPDPALEALANRCRAMDMNADRVVNALDGQIAESRVGTPPGPASAAASTNGCFPVDCNDGDPCTHDYCEPGSNECRHVDRTCDDGNACTADSCDASTGECLNLPIRCSDGNVCTIDSCNPQGGGCTFTPGNEGQTCNDNNACTTSTTCQAGACGGGTPKSCSDGNPCTADTCNPATGACSFPAGGCNDGNPCTTDACVPGPSGNLCSNTTLPNGSTCSDGDLCTSGDACNGGVCRSNPVTCNDGDLCTTDACDPATGQCGSAAVSCGDGDVCTFDSCDPATGQCAHEVTFAQAISLEAAGPSGIGWTAPRLSGEWNVYRGTIPKGLMGSRAGAYDHLCLERGDFIGDGFTHSIDPTTPPLGTAWYYVVAEKTGCGEGPPGFDSAGSARPIPNPCVVP